MNSTASTKISTTYYYYYNRFCGCLNFLRDNLDEPVPEETFILSQLSWSSIIPYLLPPSITIHGILPVQFTCLTVFCTITVRVFFRLPFGMAPSTSYAIHFFTQSLSSFRSTCPYHRSLFRCSTEIMSSNYSSLPLSSLLGTLSCNFTPHIHLTILNSAL